jgi:glyoxylase-like metal-dependent hydrolase (beta-lactamase superfamily II)
MKCVACRLVRELGIGIWHWEAQHPEFNRAVSSYAIEEREHLLLFDPLAVPSEIEERAAERETAIVLTCPWHRRDSLSLAGSLGAPIYVPPPDEADPEPVAGEVFREGDGLPVGVQAFAGMEPNDLALWVESRRAVVFGDTLVDFGNGLEFRREWASTGPPAARGVSPEQILEGLRPLLELPVEHVLATHGGPFDRSALERALS